MQVWLQYLRICLEVEIICITGVTALSGVGCRGYVDGLPSITQYYRYYSQTMYINQLPDHRDLSLVEIDLIDPGAPPNFQ